MKKEFNQMILAKLERSLFNEIYNSVLGRGNISSRIEMTRKEKPGYLTAWSADNRDTARKHPHGAPAHQV